MAMKDDRIVHTTTYRDKKGRRKYYDISGIAVDDSGNGVGTINTPTMKQRQDFYKAYDRQKLGIKSVEQTQKTLQQANKEYDLATKKYQDALSRELKKTGVDYRTRFEDLSKKRISYQTKDKDKPKNQPTAIPMVETAQKLKEYKEKNKAADKVLRAEYENNLAKVYDEKTTNVDRLLYPVRKVAGMFDNLGGTNAIEDENGNKTFLPSYNDLKNQKVRQDTSGLAGVAMDVTGEGAKILTSAGVDLLTGGIGGKALYWSDMAADNYKNVRNQGYDNTAAIANTIISTGSEFLTEKLMGGLAKPLTGAKISDTQKVFANAFARATKNPKIANLLGSMTSEGLEEFTQEFIGALNNKITLGQDTNIDDLVQDALYSGLIGAGTGGLVTGAMGNVEGNIAQQNYNAMGNTLADLNMLQETNNSERVNEAIDAAQNYQKNVFTADYEKTMEKVNNLNEVEREALTQITQKRLAGEILDQNDLDTINYLNNREQMQTDLSNKVQETPQELKPIDTSDKILNFRNSVENEGIQDADGFYKAAEKIIQDKDYNVIMDSSITNEKGKPVNAVISNENGITIRINPKSERAAEILLMHEVTHGIETKEMSNLIMNYASKNAEFNDALQSLKKAYGTEDITPEVVADISGQLLGRQDFINSLSTENPSIFKMIYDKIIELKNKLTGNSNYDNFVKDLAVKWERAYRKANVQSSQQNLKEGARYSENAEYGEKLSDIKESYGEGFRDYLYYAASEKLSEEQSEDFADLFFDDSIKTYTDLKEAAEKMGVEIPAPTTKMWELTDSEEIEEIGISAKAKDAFDNMTLRQFIKEYKNTQNIKEKDEGLDDYEEINFDDIMSGYTPKKKAQTNETTDNEGRKLSKAQQERFKDSKIRDENGALIRVYHTTTNPVIQFNEFNPVGTPYYRFGDTVVNYFSESKKMSGSYAKGKYEMADTKKLESIKDVEDYFFENGLIGFEISNNKVYDDEGAPILEYKSLNDLLRNLKSDLQKEIGDPDYVTKLQYEGYLNMKNPYVVESEDQFWDEVEKEVDEEKDKVIKAVKNHETEIIRLAEESEEKFNNWNKDEEYEELSALMDQLRFSSDVESDTSIMIKNNLFEAAENYEQFQKSAKENGFDIPSSDTKLKDAIKDIDVLEEYTFKNKKAKLEEMKNWTISDLMDNYQRVKKEWDEFGGGDYFWFAEKFRELLGDEIVDDFSDWDEIYEIAQNDFDEDMIDDYVKSKAVETNDIVKRVIKMNENLPENKKYDGVIFRKIYDYAGPIDEWETETPEDVYVTFNSNQFKAVDNLNPTDDADIRYSKEVKKWQDWLEKNFKNEGPKTVLKDHIKTKKQIKKDMIDKGVKPKVAEILTETPRVEEKKSSLREDWHKLKRKFVDKGEAVYRLAKKTKNRLLYATYDKMGTSVGEANYHIGEAQTTLKGNAYRNFTDKDGKKVSMSLNQIWEGIDPKIANEYLAHYLNMDRYKQKNLSGENRYVFGESVTDKDSAKRVKELEKAHPELKRFGENVWQYGRNQLKNMVDSGIISKEQAEQFVLDTPHYVRLQRNVSKGSKNKIEVDKDGNARVNKQIKEFKGSDLDILPFKDTMAQYTLDVIQSMRANLFGQELAKTLGMSSTNDTVESVDEIFGFNPDLIKDNEDGTYSFTIFNKGQAITLPIDEGIYEALQPNKKYDIEDAAIFSGKFGIRNADKFRRSLLTDKNPLFLATNMLKDLFDAPLNSQRPTAFVANYIPAIKQIVTNGKYYQQYKSLGGLQNTYFDSKEGFKKQRNKLNPVGWFEKANNAVEQFPRLAEFMATMKATGNIDEAMYNAAEITTNFKRGGDITKAINRNGGTFLNASVQGFSRFVRNFSDIQNPQQAVKMLAKIVALGIGPALLNDMVYDDDDEYKDLQDYIKDNYYLIKGKNGTWIRIPKGRAVSVFQDAARRTKYRLRGDKDAFKGMWSTFKNQIAPNNVFDSNIASPFVQVANNKSWSGNPIVSDYTKNAKHPEEEYDVKTDELSKWLGKTFHYSPKKINYIIDQYSGVIGDFALPIGTKYAESKSDNPLYQAFVNPALSKFTTNSVTSSKAQQEFYQALQDAQDDRYWSKGTSKDTAVHKYLSSKNREISSIRKEMTELQESNKPAAEKFEGALEYQKQINEIAKDAVKQSKSIKETHEEEYEIGGNYYAGEETSAIRPETVQKAQNLGLSIGEWQEISTYKSETRADKRADGSTIRGSAKQKVIDYIYSKQELTEAQKRQILEQLYPKR